MSDMLSDIFAKASAWLASVFPAVRDLTGPLGAAAALYWFKGRGWRKLFAFVFGSSLALICSPYLAKWSGMEQGLAGFLLGLFGMAVVSKAYKALDDMDLGVLLNKWLKKRLDVEDTK